MLLACGKDMISTPDKFPGPSINTAAMLGDLKMIQYLLIYGADFQKKNNMGRTALHQAAQGGHIEVIKLLLDKGANPKHEDAQKSTPLHLAAANGHIDAARVLIDHMQASDLDMFDGEQQTALHLAAFNGTLELVKLLIGCGASTQAVDKKCLSPAERSGCVDVWYIEDHKERQAETAPPLTVISAPQKGKSKSVRMGEEQTVHWVDS